jgi:hypothetical protein
MILFGVDGMAAANKPNSDQYLDNYEKIFKKEDKKVIQKSTNSNEEVEKKKEEDILL